MSSHFRAVFVLPSLTARSGAVDFIVDLADAMADQSCDIEILALGGGAEPVRGPGESVTVSIANESSSAGIADSRHPYGVYQIGVPASCCASARPGTNKEIRLVRNRVEILVSIKRSPGKFHVWFFAP